MIPAQIALDFCRECLGWERPVDRKYAEMNRGATGLGSLAWTPYVFDFYGKNDQFHYTELNAVIPAVRSWCDHTGCRIELHYSPDQNGFGVLCEGIDTWDADPCHALLSPASKLSAN